MEHSNHIIEINSLSHFIDTVCSLREEELTECWFRGIGSLGYDLLPGLYWQDGAKENEASICHRFLVSFKAYGDFSKLNSWEKFALMQHHGLPTRLLDWTENPLIALYFSVTQTSKANEDFAVWAIDPYSLNYLNYGYQEEVYCPSEMAVRKAILNDESFDLDSFLPPLLCPCFPNKLHPKPIAIQSSYGSARIKAQMGCFTVHGSENSPIDSYLVKHQKAVKMVFKNSNKQNLREELKRQLNSLAINQETIFQDLDHLSDRIKADFQLV